jgi:virginiamycin B lyase
MHLARMTTAGSVTEFDESLDHISGLTVGPDGNIWTSRTGTTQHGQPTPSRIARLTPTGVLTSFYDSSFGQWALTSITGGPDGNLWFANNPNFYSDHYLVRMTTTGTLTGSFLLPDASAGIASGSDGALWFLLRSLNQVGRSTTDGAMNSYSVPTAASGLEDMVAGPDGALWFTESAANQIGRLAPESPTPTPLPTLTPTPGVTPGPAGRTVPALSTMGAALLVLLLGAAGVLFLPLR